MTNETEIPSFGNIENIEKIKDPLDVYELISKVHSQSEDINKDFTFAWTDKALEDWIAKQMELANDLYDQIKTSDKDEAKIQKNILIQEIILRIIFTRSHEGRVLQAGLRFNRKDDDGVSEIQAKNFLEKMTKPAPKEEGM